jgi:hypothetical protein
MLPQCLPITTTPPEIDIIAIRIPKKLLLTIYIYACCQRNPIQQQTTSSCHFIKFHAKKHLDKLWWIHHPEEFGQFGIFNPYYLTIIDVATRSLPSPVELPGDHAALVPTWRREPK